MSLALAACAASAASAPTVARPVAPTATISSAPPTADAGQITLKISRNANLGNILTDARGDTLYTFKSDPPNTTTCASGCDQTWPAVTIAKGAAPLADKGIAANIGVIVRADNTYQITYNDAPLYRYAGDRNPGDANGNGLAGLWLAVTLPPSTVAPSPATGPVDWTTKGFAVTLATQQVATGSSATVTTGPYTIQIPAGAFDVPVKFVVLAGDLIAFVPKLPAGQQLMFSLAVDVYDARTNQLLDKFNHPLTLTVDSPDIFPQTVFYDVAADHNCFPDTPGLFVQSGKLVHPLSAPTTGWLITAPAAPPSPN